MNSHSTPPDTSPNPPKRKAIVLHPFTPELSLRGVDAQDRLEEAVNLASAIDLEVVHKDWVNIKLIKPNTFIGDGIIEQLADIHRSKAVDVVIIDANLSPIQQRNLERKINTKVIDRTGLILEIFGERAQTQEGSLQVELAALSYQKSRLVRSWTHLERQRGGLGFIGGPGESQIELDRRLISERITRIEKELEKVKKRRILQRKNRERTPYPVIALVGYTNAGKSTLFNQLTQSKVFAKDMLFATLDPTMRKLALPSGHDVILSDTVGFISDLPTQLIAAFRATLEEVLEADIILHVRDISSHASQMQKQDVLNVLKELSIDLKNTKLLEVANKCDLLTSMERENLRTAMKVSAITGEGLEDLKLKLDQMLQEDYKQLTVKVPVERGDVVAWIHENSAVKESQTNQKKTHVMLKTSISESKFAKLKDKYPDVDCKSF